MAYFTNDPPPFGVPMNLPNGEIHDQWRRWFQQVTDKSNLVQPPVGPSYDGDIFDEGDSTTVYSAGDYTIDEGSSTMMYDADSYIIDEGGA